MNKGEEMVMNGKWTEINGNEARGGFRNVNEWKGNENENKREEVVMNKDERLWMEMNGMWTETNGNMMENEQRQMIMKKREEFKM